MRIVLKVIVCLFFSSIQSADQQLLLFLHTQSQSFGDEEGLNVAYQALTAIMQKAAPILMSENIWQHVVIRKDRFKKGLQDKKSVQSAVVLMHKKVNEILKEKHHDLSSVNKLYNQFWYQQEYPELSKLSQDVYKHLLFDYFCFYVFDHFYGWKTYQLSQGYILWIPKNKAHGFVLKNAKIKSKIELTKPTFVNKSLEVQDVLKSCMSFDKSVVWSLYVTGHGFHKDSEQPLAGIAGMPLLSFKKLLLFLDNAITTKLLAYSSCFGAGQHTIIPYQDEDNKDLKLSYPVIVVSLTDAPVYVFGAPSGLKLPPYGLDNFLSAEDVNNQGLKPYLLQNFTMFCHYLLSENIDEKLSKAINPYVECNLDDCTILKIENVPLIRRAYSSFFIPLDGFQLYSITNSVDQVAELKDKRACLWYVNQYMGTIAISKKIPTFVSMIPGNQIHRATCLQAPEVSFEELIRGLFLSIDDVQEQKIYFFDKVCCSVLINDISSTKINELEQVLILPKGPWSPSVTQIEASCYVYIQYEDRVFCICFDQEKQIPNVQKLEKEQQLMLLRFKRLLFQSCELGNNVSAQTLLSAQYFKIHNQLQKELLDICLQEKICK